MNVHAVAPLPDMAHYTATTNSTGHPKLGKVAPENDNGGIVPPWLQVYPLIRTNMVGIHPVDPNVPHIM